MLKFIFLFYIYYQTIYILCDPISNPIRLDGDIEEAIPWFYKDMNENFNHTFHLKSDFLDISLYPPLLTHLDPRRSIDMDKEEQMCGSNHDLHLSISYVSKLSGPVVSTPLIYSLNENNVVDNDHLSIHKKEELSQFNPSKSIIISTFNRHVEIIDGLTGGVSDISHPYWDWPYILPSREYHENIDIDYWQENNDLFNKNQENIEEEDTTTMGKKTRAASLYVSPLIYDIDGDGQEEICIVDFSGRVEWLETKPSFYDINVNERIKEHYGFWLPNLKVRADWYEGLDAEYVEAFMHLSQFDYRDTNLDINTIENNNNGPRRNILSFSGDQEDYNLINNHNLENPINNNQNMDHNDQNNLKENHQKQFDPAFQQFLNQENHQERENLDPSLRDMDQNLDRQQERELKLQQENELELQQQREQIERENELQRQRELELQQQREQIESQKFNEQQERENELQRQRELELQQQREQIERENELQRQRELELQQQREQQERENELQRQREFDLQQQMERQERQNELQRQRELELQQQREQQENLEKENNKNENEFLPTNLNQIIKETTSPPTPEYSWDRSREYLLWSDDLFSLPSVDDLQIAENFPKNKYISIDAHVLSTPIIHDITNDGNPDLLFSVSYFFDPLTYPMAALHPSFHGKNGMIPYSKFVGGGILSYDLYNKRWNWAVHLDQTTDETEYRAYIHSTPIIADLDGDSILEVIIGTSLGLIYVLEGNDGSIKKGFPIQVGDIRGDIAVADISGDSHDLELIVSDMKGNLLCINYEGKILWHEKLAGSSPYGPIIGDMNGDSILDVIVIAEKFNFASDEYEESTSASSTDIPGTIPNSASVFIWVVNGINGKLLPNFPIHLNNIKKLDSQISSPLISGTFFSKPLIIDISNNNDNNNNNNENKKYNLKLNQNQNQNNYNNISPLSIILPCANGYIYIIDGKNGCVNHIDIGEEVTGRILADDITGDGYIDFIMGTLSGHLITLNTNILYTPENIWDSEIKHRRNNFIHGSFQGIKILNRHELQGHDIYGPWITIEFEIYDNRKKLHPNEAFYEVLISRGTNIKNNILFKKMYDKPGIYKERFSLRIPEYTNIIITMTNEHSQIYEDSVSISFNIGHYKPIKWFIIIPLIFCIIQVILFGQHLMKK